MKNRIVSKTEKDNICKSSNIEARSFRGPSGLLHQLDGKCFVRWYCSWYSIMYTVKSLNSDQTFNWRKWSHGEKKYMWLPVPYNSKRIHHQDHVLNYLNWDEPWQKVGLVCGQTLYMQKVLNSYIMVHKYTDFGASLKLVAEFEKEVTRSSI